MAVCKHCARAIDYVEGVWRDPEATGDDAVWSETCDEHDTFQAEHEPDDFERRVERSDAFGHGVQLGASVENRVAVRAVAIAALLVLGKDRSDGAVDLGALGTWSVGDFRNM